MNMTKETFTDKNYQEGLNLDARLTELGVTWDELREWFNNKKNYNNI